jgi:hypothetical integral membrane protein (TIGR02206 family)
MHPWRLFSPEHLAALALIALAGGGGVYTSRRQSARGARLLRRALAAALATLFGAEVYLAWRGGWLTWDVLLPLHLCDLAALLCVWTLLRPEPRVVELLYFWALSGTLLATLTPDLAHGFPSLDYFVFFGLHGLVIVAVLVLVFGLGWLPAPGAWRRAFAWTLLYAALVGAVNRLLGTNFMYLCAKPAGATLLDAFGPWPWYLVTSAGLALVLFRVLDLPLRRVSRVSPGPRAR